MVTAEKSDVSIWKEFEEKRDINTRNKIILQYEYLVRLVVSKLITKYKSCNEYDDLSVMECSVLLMRWRNTIQKRR